MNANLAERIIDPLNSILRSRIETILYHDVHDKGLLADNGNGIHILGHQLEFVFADQRRLYVSWNGVRGWEHYSIDCSPRPYVDDSCSYEMDSHESWRGIPGSNINGFSIYGYRERGNDINTPAGPHETPAAAPDEPHLIQLELHDSKRIAIANFYSEQDFVPRIPTGDDIWIFFNHVDVTDVIEKFRFDALYEC